MPRPLFGCHDRRPRPKKRLGQHFLVDENILGVIGRLAALDPEDAVLEVGPGLGVLTRYLAERVAVVHAIELDRSLEQPLLAALEGRDNVRLLFGDALVLDLSALEPQPNKLVANLPYNIATPLVVESLDGIPALERWCVMVQREVAERFFAAPRTKAYGAVSVLVQLATRKVGFHAVPPTVFKPPAACRFGAGRVRTYCRPAARTGAGRSYRPPSPIGERRSRTPSPSLVSQAVRMPSKRSPQSESRQVRAPRSSRRTTSSFSPRRFDDKATRAGEAQSRTGRRPASSRR